MKDNDLLAESVSLDKSRDGKAVTSHAHSIMESFHAGRNFQLSAGRSYTYVDITPEILSRKSAQKNQKIDKTLDFEQALEKFSARFSFPAD